MQKNIYRTCHNMARATLILLITPVAEFQVGGTNNHKEDNV